MTPLQEFTPLAAQLKAVNLGQGFPDWPSPQFCKEAAKRAVDADFNQVILLLTSSRNGLWRHALNPFGPLSFQLTQ